MSAENDLALAYHMGYDDALAKRRPDASKTQVLAPYDLAAENAKLREQAARLFDTACKHVADLQGVLTENAALREQMERLVTLLRNDCDIDASWDGLRRFWSIGLTEGGCLMRDRACKAEAENAQLRELCRRFSEYVSHDRCEGCVVKRRCNDGEVDECWQMGEIRKLARELGMGAYDG